ncbi:MAG: glycosyltransferase family 1 protein, partial [Armatimonadota bacterium]|nr:glycosyltransferase family 1 protein [Armatimonadota bacterium]
MVIIFSGAIGRSGVGGQAWVYMQYLAGLQALGHDVFYLEDPGVGSWVYHHEEEEITTDLNYPAAYVRACLEPLGLGDRWIYRAGDEAVGMPLDDFRDVCAHADLLIVRAVPLPVWREEYLWPRRRAFI